MPSFIPRRFWGPAISVLLSAIAHPGGTALRAQEAPGMTPRQRVAPTHPELGQAPFVTLPEPGVLRARLASVLGRLRSPSDSLLLPRVPESAQDAADLAGPRLGLRRRLVLGLEYRGYFILTDTTDPAAAFTSEATTYAVRRGTRFLFLPRAR